MRPLSPRQVPVGGTVRHGGRYRNAELTDSDRGRRSLLFVAALVELTHCLVSALR